MRRGLLSWSHDEVAPELLTEARARLGAALSAAGFDAMLIYTDFTRPAAVSRLTHFIPYWGQSVLLVLPDGAVTLVTNLSNRVAGWMRSVSSLEEIACGPAIGATVAEKLPSGGSGQVAVVDLARFPGGIVTDISAKRGDLQFLDGTSLFERAIAEQGAPPAVVGRLVEIASAGLEAALGQASTRDINQVIAAAEGTCRLAGAEELLIAAAPDMIADRRLRRIEGGAPLEQVFALQLSLAYKGYWLRLGRTASSEGDVPWIGEMNRWFGDLLASPALREKPAAEIARALARLKGCEADFWRLEGVQGGTPLAEIVSSVRPPDRVHLPDLVSLSMRIRHPNGWWFAAAPLPLPA